VGGGVGGWSRGRGGGGGEAVAGKGKGCRILMYRMVVGRGAGGVRKGLATGG